MKKGSSRRRGLPERMALATLALLVTLPAAGAWNSDIYVPGELEPWRAWVLHGREFRDCPFFFDRTPS
ncbi:MAG TPA: hypothetical protein VE175_16250, partial [Woeseiaceae bacterium]|nr:hypothetical protein [Woeseiaceae bacterium]